jgi:hypothetical protein
VRVVQRGTESVAAKRITWTWVEHERSVEARPFALVLHGSGERVRVLPGERVVLLARAEVTTLKRDDGTGERTLVAGLRGGERAVVTGMLSATPGEADGYRETAQAFTLQEDGCGGVRVEAESAGEEPDRAASIELRSSAYIAIVACAACVVMLGVHVIDRLRSVTALGEVIGYTTCTTRSRSGTSSYSCIEVAQPTPTGEAAATREPCARSSWTSTASPPQPDPVQGDRVLVSFVPGRCTLGAVLEPSAGLLAFLFAAALLLAVSSVAHMVRLRDGPRWFEQERLDGSEDV